MHIAAGPSMQSPTPPQLSVHMSASTFPSILAQPITSPLATRSHSTLSHHIPAQISNEVQRMFKRRFLALRPPTNSLHAHLGAVGREMPAMLVIPTCHLYFQVTSTPWESWGKALLHGSKSNLNRHIFVTDHFTKMFSCTSPG